MSIGIEALKNGGALKLIAIARKKAEEQKQSRIAEAVKTMGRELLEIAGESGRALPDFAQLIDGLVSGDMCHITVPKGIVEEDFRRHAEDLKVALCNIAIVEITDPWLGGCTVQLISAK